MSDMNTTSQSMKEGMAPYTPAGALVFFGADRELRP